MVEEKKTATKAATKEENVTVTKKASNKEKKSDSFAVIKTGGKQYKVAVGDKLFVEKLEVKEGEKLKISEVLLKVDGAKVEVGTPLLKDAKVEATVLSQEKADKIIVFKYKKRKNYRRKQGHRQKLTKLEITSI